MAFPTSSLTNNQVHKEGNRSFVYDSALGVWDQVKETSRGGDMGSGSNFPIGHVRQIVQGPISDSSVATSSTNATGSTVASYTQASIENVQAGNNIWVTSNTPLRAYSNAGAWINSNLWLYWFTGGAGYAPVMGASDGNTSSPYHLARIYYDETGDGPGNFYHDAAVPLNFMHKNVAAGTHYYKVYFNVSGTGTITYGWDELPGTMQLTEIVA